MCIRDRPCTVKDLKNKFGGDRGADRKVMEAVDQLVHEAVICPVSYTHLDVYKRQL